MEGSPDPLDQKLADLKSEAEADASAAAAPIVVVAEKPAKKGKLRGGKGRTVYSRIKAIRVPAVPQRLNLEPGLRFLVVTGVLLLLTVIAFFLSRYVR